MSNSPTITLNKLETHPNILFKFIFFSIEIYDIYFILIISTFLSYKLLNIFMLYPLDSKYFLTILMIGLHIVLIISSISGIDLDSLNSVEI